MREAPAGYARQHDALRNFRYGQLALQGRRSGGESPARLGVSV